MIRYNGQYLGPPPLRRPPLDTGHPIREAERYCCREGKNRIKEGLEFQPDVMHFRAMVAWGWETFRIDDLQAHVVYYRGEPALKLIRQLLETVDILLQVFGRHDGLQGRLVQHIFFFYHHQARIRFTDRRRSSDPPACVKRYQAQIREPESGWLVYL